MHSIFETDVSDFLLRGGLLKFGPPDHPNSTSRATPLKRKVRKATAGRGHFVESFNRGVERDRKESHDQ